MGRKSSKKSRPALPGSPRHFENDHTLDDRIKVHDLCLGALLLFIDRRIEVAETTDKLQNICTKGTPMSNHLLQLWKCKWAEDHQGPLVLKSVRTEARIGATARGGESKAEQTEADVSAELTLIHQSIKDQSRDVRIFQRWFDKNGQQFFKGIKWHECWPTL
mgnify:CR=1 FL=1